MKLQKSLSLSVAVLLMLCVVAACGSRCAHRRVFRKGPWR